MKIVNLKGSPKKTMERILIRERFAIDNEEYVVVDDG